MKYEHYTVEEYHDSYYHSYPIKINDWRFPDPEWDFKCTFCGTRYLVAQSHTRHYMTGPESSYYHRCPRCGHDNKGYIHGFSRYDAHYVDIDE